LRVAGARHRGLVAGSSGSWPAARVATPAPEFIAPAAAAPERPAERDEIDDLFAGRKRFSPLVREAVSLPRGETIMASRGCVR
jgi:hypothetical protein